MTTAESAGLSAAPPTDGVLGVGIGTTGAASGCLDPMLIWAVRSAKLWLAEVTSMAVVDAAVVSKAERAVANDASVGAL